MNPSEKNYHFK